MESFDSIFQRAAERKGGVAALQELLPIAETEQGLRDLPDDRVLAEMTKCIFRSGFVWKVVENKWPHFEAAFHGFDVTRCALLSDEELEALAKNKQIMRNKVKIRSVRSNASFILDIRAEHGSFGNYLADLSLQDSRAFLDFIQTFGRANKKGTSRLAATHEWLDGLNNRALLQRWREFYTEMADRFADDGFAFVQVNPVFDKDESGKTVDTIFSIIKNQRVYVRRIDISGNQYTRDEVIRRELRQYEGSWYSVSAVQRSKDRLQRMGIFESVQIEIPEVAGTTDQVDMKVVVVERSTGSVLLSAGYSDEDGGLVGAEFEQRHLLGTGKDLAVEYNNSDASSIASISYTNPCH